MPSLEKILKKADEKAKNGEYVDENFVNEFIHQDIEPDVVKNI